MLRRKLWTLLTKSRGHSCMSVSFLRGSVNSPGCYRAAATSQQLSDRDGSRSHGEYVPNTIYYVLNLSLGLYCVSDSGLMSCWSGGNAAFIVVCCARAYLDMPDNRLLPSHVVGAMLLHKIPPKKFTPESNWTNHTWCECDLKLFPSLPCHFPIFILFFYDTPVGACVQQSDTSRRSMVTFTRSQILSPSFRVTLSAAACSLFLFRSSGVRGSQRDGLLSWFLFRHTLACWDATHCLWQWNSCNSLLLTPESISNPPLRCFLVVLVQIANWLKSILKRQKKHHLLSFL